MEGAWWLEITTVCPETRIVAMCRQRKLSPDAECDDQKPCAFVISYKTEKSVTRIETYVNSII